MTQLRDSYKRVSGSPKFPTSHTVELDFYRAQPAGDKIIAGIKLFLYRFFEGSAVQLNPALGNVFNQLGLDGFIHGRLLVLVKGIQIDGPSTSRSVD